MTRYVWYPVNRLLRMIEPLYHRLKRLRPVGALFYVQQATYEGPARELTGGVRLRSGQPLGILHFNNRGLQRAQRSGGSAGFVFARLMLATLADLADAVERDPELKRLVAFRGITWIPPHGRGVGFEAVPLPDTWRNRLLGWYFRLLLFAFNPASSRRFRRRLQPYEFWLSREHLLEQFSTDRNMR